jgi:hydroxypyruvate reductase
MRDAHADAETIFRAGLARVDPLAMMERVLTLSGDTLRVTTESECHAYDLSRYRRIIVLGAGKASARLALGLERVLGDRLWDGVVAVKEGYGEPLAGLTLLEAGHPVPDERSAVAARAVLGLAGQAGPDDLVIVLVSGGGSAILAAPLSVPGYDLTLADKQEVTRALLACGAAIQDINRVRKKLSAIKGGRLAQAIAPAHCLSLILSDVVGDDLDAIASGPTVPDTSTPAEVLEVLDRYGLAGRIPTAAERVLRDLARGLVPDTPKADDPVFSTTRTVLVGTNHQALLAARDKAEALGYNTLILTSHLTGEAREMARLFLGLAQDIAAHGLPLAPPACVIAGGETTVTLRGPGKGGRNQEMGLAYLDVLSRGARDAESAVFLAASTDGGDGPTDAAGAFASLAILRRGWELGLDPARFLAQNDAYHYFEAVGQLLVTGPTNTNVCDIKVLVSP